MNLRGLLIALVALNVTVSGCGRKEDPRLAHWQQQLLTSTCPQNPLSIASVSNSAALADEVTLAGRIYGGKQSPFDPDSASFTIIELPEPGHDHDDPGDCPFCKRKADNAAMAVVQVLDESGAPIAMPADKLLGLKQSQDVVVTGVPVRIGEILMLNASAVHVLDKEKALQLAAQFAGEHAS